MADEPCFLIPAAAQPDEGSFAAWGCDCLRTNEADGIAGHLESLNRTIWSTRECLCTKFTTERCIARVDAITRFKALTAVAIDMVVAYRHGLAFSEHQHPTGGAAVIQYDVAGCVAGGQGKHRNQWKYRHVVLSGWRRMVPGE